MKFSSGIASTTHIDKHFEKMAKSALEGAANQINTKYIPFLIEHDPNKQIGILLAAKVLPMEDGEWALYYIAGIFENTLEKDLYKNASPNTVSEKYLHFLDTVHTPLSVQIKEKTTTKKLNLADLLEIHLNSTQVYEDGRIIKIKRFIASVGDLSIQVYPNDHLPAHFHVIAKSKKIDARFDLYTFELLSHKKGKISNVDQAKIRNFFETNIVAKEFLFQEHERLRSQTTPSHSTGKKLPK